MMSGELQARFDLYIRKANRNLRIAAFLAGRKKNYDDWVVVLLFYAAVQLSNADQLALTGMWFTSHGAAERAMDPWRPIPSSYAWAAFAFSAYQSLQRASRSARYLHNGEKTSDSVLGVGVNAVWVAMQDMQDVIDYFLTLHPAAAIARVHIPTPLASRPLAHLLAAAD